MEVRDYWEKFNVLQRENEMTSPTLHPLFKGVLFRL